MKDDYFNINYDYYWLSVAKLGQALFMICIGFCLILVSNVVVFVGAKAFGKNSRLGMFFHSCLAQYKFNVYIRYYMLCYFDLTFFSVMKLIEGDDSTQGRKMATIASYVIFSFSVVVPIFLITVVCRRYEVMKIKHAKESFNTLVLNIDKQSRWRLIVPGYFFFRRLLTAGLLSMPINNTFIFLQYVFILMSSHAYVLYLVAIKPYQSPLLNNYVLSNETFYSALIIAIFIFSDATPELSIKFGAGVVLISSIYLLIFTNACMIVVIVFRGREKMKEDIKQSKLKRAEKELMEEEEEEERRQRQKREEEEFTRLPEDTTNMSHYDLASASNPNQGEDDVKGGSKKRKGKKNKNKNNNDDVQEYDAYNNVAVTPGDFNTSEMGNTTNQLNDTEAPMKGKKVKDKKKKRKDKHKNRQDDVVDDQIQGPEHDPTVEGAGLQLPSSDPEKGKKTKGSTDEGPSGSSSSDKKKKKKGSKPTENDDRNDLI